MTTKVKKGMGEEELWELVRQGDKKSVGMVFNCYADDMLAYGMKLSPDRNLVKDSIQNVFLQILSSDGRLGPTSNIKAYLLCSLRRTLAKQAQAHSMLQLSDSLTFNIDLQNFIQDDRQNSDDDMQQLLKQLVAAIDTLPPREKEMVYLHFIQGIPYDEAAVIMGIGYQSARSLNHRAIRHLRTLLADVPHQKLTFLLAWLACATPQASYCAS